MKTFFLTLLFLFYSSLSFATSPDNINFFTGKSELNEDSKMLLERVVNWLNSFPRLQLELRGHTDAFECKDSLDAIRLGWERAFNAKKYLIDRGIKECRIPVRSYGKDNPAVPNIIGGKENAANKAINRRVEFFGRSKDYKLFVSR